MATFIALITETQKGEVHISESVSRTSKISDVARKFGAKVKDIYWTLGEYDGILVFEAPDDETAAAFLHYVTSKGSVRTHTMRAFNSDEMQSILERISQNP